MKKQDFLNSLQKIIFVALSYIPLGLASGIALQRVGFTPWGILAMSLLAFTGAGQFMTSSMVAAGAAAPSIIILNLFLSLRMSLMTSSLSQFVRGKSKPFLALFGQTTADETFGVNFLEFETNPDWTPNKALTASAIAYLTWSVSNFVGGLIGNVVTIPTTVINFLMTAMFISLMISNLVTRTFVVAGFTAGILAVILKVIFENNMALVVAAIIGSFVGYYLETRKKGAFVNG